jgi:CRISPR/Cas system CSM-associated protein Csm3 (group 7 of RAMP superfamily)
VAEVKKVIIDGSMNIAVDMTIGTGKTIKNTGEVLMMP